MKNVAIFLFLLLGVASPAAALGGPTGNVERLEFVSITHIPGPDQTTMSLCHLKSEFQVFGITLTSSIKGYALSSDACGDVLDRPFTPEQMATAQSLGLVALDLPRVAQNTWERDLQNYGLWLAVGLALIAVILRRVKSLMGLDPDGPLRKKASLRILSAMCHAGNCDGIVPASEIALIGATMTRLTRRNYSAAEIIHVTDNLANTIEAQDFIAFGSGLRDSEKDVMMRAVLFIMLADGTMLPTEYAFATSLAGGLGMPANDFRRILNLALDDRDRYIA